MLPRERTCAKLPASGRTRAPLLESLSDDPCQLNATKKEESNERFHIFCNVQRRKSLVALFMKTNSQARNPLFDSRGTHKISGRSCNSRYMQSEINFNLKLHQRSSASGFLMDVSTKPWHSILPPHYVTTNSSENLPYPTGNA